DRDGNMLLWWSEKSALQQQQLERQEQQLELLLGLLRRSGVSERDLDLDNLS
ncbi:MAG: hypothetical protein F6K35_37895, partial [Okeania sp. SIO2H7]|nr:hypothetical protein [Okeania sp. SIO2H7]